MGLSVIVTIACGLMLSTSGAYETSLLFWHKWMGIALGTGIIFSGVAFYKKRFKVYNAALIFNLLLLGPASHFGGSMTHGKNYLFAYAPNWMRPATDAAVPVAVIPAAAPAGPAQANVYADLVQPILQQNCIACHGADKSSGQLRLDSVAFIRQGGHTGPAIVDRDSNGSLLMQRLQLAAQDAKHMPPDGKPQPTDDQIDTLKWWIDNGAPDTKKVGDLNPTDDQLSLVSRLLKLPAPTDPTTAPPLPVADAREEVAALTPQTGIVVTPFAVDQPWIIVNAALSKTFGDRQLAMLAPLASNIVDLNLSGTQITDAGLLTVSTMSNLTKLRLDRTAITDAGLGHLTKLKKLNYLNLYRTDVTDTGLKTLTALPKLQHLYLYQTKVHPEAAEQFAASKTDETKIARLKKQIALLQEQMSVAGVEVVGAVAPTTMHAAASPSK